MKKIIDYSFLSLATLSYRLQLLESLKLCPLFSSIHPLKFFGFQRPFRGAISNFTPNGASNLSKGVMLLSILTFFSLTFSNAQTAIDTTKSIDLQQVTITATMASDNTPMTFTNINKATIRKNDYGQDIPFLLKSTPSVVETSDAGAGIGYTGLRIRGTDATRINVTIDGIPINDSESQSVYWVNMPDMAASTSMIQIQRGVGTSTNGAGAFGATVNMVTNALQPTRYMNYAGAMGSFNTQKHSVSAGTGIVAKHFAFDVRSSFIKSDGYVDRASSDLRSYYISGLYFTNKSSLKLKVFSGREKTYQSWYGIPFTYLTDTLLRTYNPAGTEKSGTPYGNQVDNYRQSHIHLVFNHQFNPNLKANISLHYTRGKGYYEEYKANQQLKNYYAGFTDTTNLIRRLWLDNDFYGGIYSLTYTKKKFSSTLGGGYNIYDGYHFGEVIWKEKMDFNGLLDPASFYGSISKKTDFNIYEKINYALSDNINAYIDVQYRQIAYNTEGIDMRKRDITRALSYHFFNPKIGFSLGNTEGGQLYGSFGIANREPNRNDITDAEKTKIPQSERLSDTELGWRKNTEKAQLGFNAYYMAYKNQLVITGNINDVGEQIRQNVPKSYRAGMEVEAAYALSTQWQLNWNAAFSQNKVIDFSENRDNWDTGEQDIIKHGKTNLALSPSTILNSAIVYTPIKSEKYDISLSLSTKYIGKQYLDNTSNANTILPAYGYSDFNINYQTHWGLIKNVTFKLLVNNIFDAKYANNAWVYRFNSPSYDPRPNDPYARSEGGDTYNLTGYFPQAGRNYLLGVSLGF
jgi:iron complex outermembrane recepter protein